MLALLAPLNLLLKRRPEDLGIESDGDDTPHGIGAANRTANVVDPAWLAVDWTLGRAMRTSRWTRRPAGLRVDLPPAFPSAQPG